MKAAAITREMVVSLGLKHEEYESIIKLLGRVPNFTELSVFSVMWSEHCSYKSSRIHLKHLPTKGPRVVQGPGENAGVIDIGDNQVVVFKMESHNHPSFIEPYQGAATGVGGILRDVFTMGAEPVMLLNSLRFGSPKKKKTAFLIEGIVAGIGGYGNCFGCPTVGGEILFDSSYDDNPLVNAFCLGITTKDRIFLGRADGVGNPVIYVGSKTGRDGIHGATMASKEFDDEALSQRPTVQVGDPFTEKLLLDACLEVMSEDLLVGIQDMGAAGLTSSSVEMASRSGQGIYIDLSKVPARETAMKAHEFLLSESQERMLLVAQKGKEERVREIFEKWDLSSQVIGEVTDDGLFRCSFKGIEVVSIPVMALTEAAPRYDRPAKAKKVSVVRDVIPLPKDLNKVLMELVSSENLCSRKWVYRQYDQQVRTNTVQKCGGDAAVIRIKGTKKGIAATTDCNGRYVSLDPYQGAMMAVAEAARNLVSVGATPIGVTDCLNFGSPENEEIMFQFKEAVRGISDACKAFGVPVVSGNVSFYNETNGRAIQPTPSIGMVGLLSDVDKMQTASFKRVGDQIVLLGRHDDDALGGSEYLAKFHSDFRDRLPKINLDEEKKLHQLLLELNAKALIESAHDCSEGGLVLCLLESAFSNEIGVSVKMESSLKPDCLLFGEAPSRAVVSCRKEHLNEIMKLSKKYDVPCELIGQTVKDRFVFNDLIDLDVKKLKKAWEGGFEKIISH